jgi:hypothetical protein
MVLVVEIICSVYRIKSGVSTDDVNDDDDDDDGDDGKVVEVLVP